MPTATAALACVLAALGSATVAGAKPRSCKPQGTATGRIRVTGVSCAKARRLVRADVQGKPYGGFSCKSRPYPGGANVTCRRRSATVSYQIAD